MTTLSVIVRRTHTPSVVGLSIATIDRYRRSGDFPTAVRLGPNSVGFLRQDLETWLASRKEGKA